MTITLEKYSGPKSRHTCPNCGQRGCFVRYVIDGRHVAEDVGRCGRESKCGYHKKPREYFAEHAGLADTFRTSPRTFDLQRYRPQPQPDHIEPRHLTDTLCGYEENAFVQFLLDLFPNDAEDVFGAVRSYMIGTKDRFTVFPTINRHGKICKAKLIKFDPASGKRIKDGYSISSLEAKLKRAGMLKADFETDKGAFFGEHLLRKYPELPVAIVEAEKTAVIASICKGVFPDLVWLAAGSKQWLKADRLVRIGRDRKIILYPDADGFRDWSEVARAASASGLSVRLSRLIETLGSEEEKANGFDLADYLIRDQEAINKHNGQTPEDRAIIAAERAAIEDETA